MAEIQDAYGPTISDNRFDALVVSQETVSGGQKVVQKRLEAGLKPMELVEVQLLVKGIGKMSSTTIRAWLEHLETHSSDK